MRMACRTFAVAAPRLFLEPHLAGGRFSGALTVHHSDRQPQEYLVRFRCEAAVGDAGDKKAQQSGRRSQVESPQGGAQRRIETECSKTFPDVGEVGANENQAGHSHVEESLEVRVVRM